MSKETLVNAAREVGVAEAHLNEDLLQQDKFDRAAECMTMNENETSSLTPLPSTPSELIVSPNKTWVRLLLGREI